MRNRSLLASLFFTLLLQGCNDPKETIAQPKTVKEPVNESPSLSAPTQEYSDNDIQIDTPIVSETLDETMIETENSPEELSTVYAGEELYPQDPEFKPEIQSAIDAVEGRPTTPKPPKELKPEYRDVAEVLESQINEY